MSANGSDKTILNMAWERLIRRICQQVDFELRNNSDGMAIVQLALVIDISKRPLFWSSPKVTRIEGANGANRDRLLDIFTNSE
jgi:hypothetical protein